MLQSFYLILFKWNINRLNPARQKKQSSEIKGAGIIRFLYVARTGLNNEWLKFENKVSNIYYSMIYRESNLFIFFSYAYTLVFQLHNYLSVLFNIMRLKFQRAPSKLLLHFITR